MGVIAPSQIQLLIEGINVVFVSGNPILIQSFVAANRDLVADQDIVWYEPLSQRPFKINHAGILDSLEPISEILNFGTDTTYSNGDGLLENLDWKIVIAGAGTAVQSGGKLILGTSGATADVSFIEKQEDLRSRGTWILKYGYKQIILFGGDNTGHVVVRNAKAVTGLTNAIHWSNTTSEGKVRQISQGVGTIPDTHYALQHKNTSGANVNDVFIADQWAGDRVINIIERKSDRFTVTFDELNVTTAGTDVTDVLFSAIRTPFDSDFIQIAAAPLTDFAGATIEIDFIDLRTA